MRRALAVALIGTAVLVASGCAPKRSASERALDWLWSQQRADGLLQAETYGVLRRGESATAAALLATALLPPALRTPHAPAMQRAFAALQQPTRSAEPVDYPCYTAACHLHALALLQPDGWQAQVERRTAELRTLQCGRDNGWQREDPSYGGFGLGGRPPRHPEGADLVTLSTTTMVLEAARAAGLATDDPLLVAGRIFVERCQRMPDAGGDGGFCATPGGEFRGGKGGADERGNKRNYGTATADGVRALLACGHQASHARVLAADAWLQSHEAERVPGLLPAYESGLRFYWAAARQRTAGALRQSPPPLPKWLLPRQRDDGAFVGFSPAMKEDCPVVATTLALLALR